MGSSLSPTLENHLNGFPDSGAVSPKLKLGENERLAVMITMCKGCHDNEQLRSNSGLGLANAFGVFQNEPVLVIRGVASFSVLGEGVDG